MLTCCVGRPGTPIAFTLQAAHCSLHGRSSRLLVHPRLAQFMVLHSPRGGGQLCDQRHDQPVAMVLRMVSMTLDGVRERSPSHPLGPHEPPHHVRPALGRASDWRNIDATGVARSRDVEALLRPTKLTVRAARTAPSGSPCRSQVRRADRMQPSEEASRSAPRRMRRRRAVMASRGQYHRGSLDEVKGQGAGESRDKSGACQEGVYSAAAAAYRRAARRRPSRRGAW